MKKLLWLDDTRNPFGEEDMTIDWVNTYSPIQPPYKVFWVKSFDEFLYWIQENGLPDAICFDHDLGMDVALQARAGGMSKRKSRQLKQQEKTGYDCAKWLVEYCMDNKLDLPKYNIQSANPVGKDNINGLLLSFIKNRT